MEESTVCFASMYNSSFNFCCCSFFSIKEHEASHKHDVVSFADHTSISNVRRHLFKHHIGDWVKACDDLQIKIYGTNARLAVQRFKNLPPPTDMEADSPEYSKEAFIDALTEFVVADDQVCKTFICK